MIRHHNKFIDITYSLVKANLMNLRPGDLSLMDMPSEISANSGRPLALLILNITLSSSLVADSFNGTWNSSPILLKIESNSYGKTLCILVSLPLFQ